MIAVGILTIITSACTKLQTKLIHLIWMNLWWQDYRSSEDLRLSGNDNHEVKNVLSSWFGKPFCQWYFHRYFSFNKYVYPDASFTDIGCSSESTFVCFTDKIKHQAISLASLWEETKKYIAIHLSLSYIRKYQYSNMEALSHSLKGALPILK